MFYFWKIVLARLIPNTDHHRHWLQLYVCFDQELKLHLLRDISRQEQLLDPSALL